MMSPYSAGLASKGLLSSPSDEARTESLAVREMTMLYFAYGSNMSSARLRARVGEVDGWGWAWLRGHEHRFSKPGFDGTGKGNVEPHAHRRVHGVLYGLSDRQLAYLTDFEGGYRRTELAIQRPGEAVVTAVTFIALRPGGAPPPSQAYLDHYREGFVEHRIPGDYARAVLRDAGDLRPLALPGDP